MAVKKRVETPEPFQAHCQSGYELAVLCGWHAKCGTLQDRQKPRSASGYKKAGPLNDPALLLQIRIQIMGRHPV